jgi:hypothetical protein
MKMKWNAFHVLATLALAAAPGLASPITVTNFSFEDLSGITMSACPGTGCFVNFSSGIPGWTAATGGLLQPGSQSPQLYYNSVPDGTTIAYGNSQTFSQTVGPTVGVGAVYTLLVDLGHQIGGTGFGVTADLRIGGTNARTITLTGSAPTAGNWATYSGSFTGLAGDTTLTIDLNGGTPGNQLQGGFDNVRLSDNSVPEPASFLLIGSALLILPALRRRRTNS